MNTERESHYANGSDHRGSRQIEQNIERTRHDMDRTLDEIAERLHPRHLIDGVVELFTSSDGESGDWTRQVRRSGRQSLRKIKRNPIPALLIGAGIAYLMMDDEDEEPPRRRAIHDQWDDLPEHSGSYVDARTGQPYRTGGDYHDPPAAAAAWHEGYDWNDAESDEQGWTSRAESTLTEIQTVTSQSDRPASERLRTAASKLLSISGRKRSEIRRALHAQWDDLPEHSGSFVDARTGKPYDQSYGQGWRHLAAAEALASSESEDEHEPGWSERAESTLKSIQEALGQSGASAKQKLSAVSEQIGSLGQSSRSFASRYGAAARQRAGSMSRATGRGFRSAGRGMQSAGRQVGDGYVASRDFVAETIDEHPLAAGAAVLGLGLLVGSLLPRTRREDEAFGDAADRVRAEATEAGRDVMERGQQVAADAGEAAMEEMDRQGLRPSRMAEGVQHTAAAVKEAVAQNVPSAGDVRQKVEKVAEVAGNTVRHEAKHQKDEMQGKRS